MGQQRLYNAATAILVVCALVITGLVVRRELLPAAPSPAREPAAVHVAGWRDYATQGRTMGRGDAPVTIVLFSDFQCPACRALAGSLRDLRTRYPDKLRVVYRHFPLEYHPLAVPAARASECAGTQGRFAEFHDALFDDQASIGTRAWEQFATAAGVKDVAAFSRCTRQEGVVAALARDSADARRLGVTGTPTLLVNGNWVYGAPPAQELEAMVLRSLAKRDGEPAHDLPPSNTRAR